MPFLIEIVSNTVLVAAFFGWLTAQVIKTILYVIVNKEFNVERLTGDGGMPSSHSSTVMATLIATGMTYGVAGFQFAIAFVVAVIVMHDAMGVRRETGKQAIVINDMMELFQEMGKMTVEESLKEFVGHTPLQVLMGAILGSGIGFAVCTFLF